MFSTLYAIARPSVCPSHGWTIQKRLKLGSWNFLCTFQRCIDYVDISGSSSARGYQTREGVKTSYFRVKCVSISKTVRDTFIVTVND